MILLVILFIILLAQVSITAALVVTGLLILLVVWAQTQPKTPIQKLRRDLDRAARRQK